jgi:hypothetical protein
MVPECVWNVNELGFDQSKISVYHSTDLLAIRTKAHSASIVFAVIALLAAICWGQWDV